MPKSRPLSFTAESDGRQGELREAVQPPGRLRIEDGFRLEVLDFAAEMDLEGGRVELLDDADAAAAGAQGRPEARNVRAERVDRAQAGDDDAPGHFLALLPLDVVDGLAHRLDLLGLVVRDGDLELFFQFHHQLDDVQRVGAHVLLKGGLARDLVLVHAQVFADDLDDTFFNGSHGRDLPRSIPVHAGANGLLHQEARKPVSLPQRPRVGQAVLSFACLVVGGRSSAQGSKWRRYTRQAKKERPQPLSGSLKRFYRSAPPRRWKDSKRSARSINL